MRGGVDGVRTCDMRICEDTCELCIYEYEVVH